MESGKTLIIAALVLVISCTVTWAYTTSTVAEECTKLGAFYVADKVYECHPKVALESKT